MEFCPTFGMLLQYELPNVGQPSRFFCPACPYVCSVPTRVKLKRKQHLIKKETQLVFTLDDMMRGGSETEATYPHCNFGRAHFQQLQIRSADEPAMTFYCCLNEKCHRMWREDLLTIEEMKERNTTSVLKRVLTNCTAQAKEYGTCVASKVPEIERDMCLKEFIALKNCMQKTLQRKV